jgi:hypothetical protein
LAVSDFTIINIQGNLDRGMENILNVCFEKIESLSLSKKSEIVIVGNNVK